MGTEHRLKVMPEPFAAMAAGVKNFEWRWNDRGFQVGDTLVLCEWDPQHGGFTGHELRRPVDYLLAGRFGVPDGYCILSWRLQESEDLKAAKAVIMHLCSVMEWRIDMGGRMRNPEARAYQNACKWLAGAADLIEPDPEGQDADLGQMWRRWIFRGRPIPEHLQKLWGVDETGKAVSGPEPQKGEADNAG